MFLYLPKKQASLSERKNIHLYTDFYLIVSTRTTLKLLESIQIQLKTFYKYFLRLGGTNLSQLFDQLQFYLGQPEAQKNSYRLTLGLDKHRTFRFFHSFVSRTYRFSNLWSADAFISSPIVKSSKFRIKRP